MFGKLTVLLAILISACDCRSRHSNQQYHQQSNYAQQGNQQQQQSQNQGPVGGTVIDIEDFHEVDRGTDIIFHDTHDLLFIKDGDKCIFVPTPDEKESQLVDGPTRRITEMDLVAKMLLSSRDIKPSSLDDVRDEFGDILANFHCAARQIFYLDFFGVKTPPPTPPMTTIRPATTATPVDRCAGHKFTGRQPSRTFCHGKKDARYPYPGDCRRFITCDHGNTNFVRCADGTSFLDNNHPCIFTATNHCCHY